MKQNEKMMKTERQMKMDTRAQTDARAQTCARARTGAETQVQPQTDRHRHKHTETHTDKTFPQPSLRKNSSELLKFPENRLTRLFSSTRRLLIGSQFVREKLSIALLF